MQGGPLKRVQLEDLVPTPIELKPTEQTEGTSPKPPRLPSKEFDEQMRMDPPEMLGLKQVPRQVKKDMDAIGMVPEDEFIKIRKHMYRGIVADETEWHMIKGSGEPID